MGFDFSSFFGGFAEGAAVQVEKKNKEIRESTTNELERLYRSAEKNKEQAMTKREELKAMASELATYKGMGGVGLDDNQILGLLQTGSAKTVLSELRSKKDQLSTVDLTSIVKVPKAEGPIDLGGELTKMTTLPKGEPLPAGTDRSTRTAFGLPTNVAAQTEDRFGKIAGMSTQDLRAAAAGMPEAPLRKDVELDLSVFKDPEGVATVSARLAENLSKGIKLSDPKNDPLVKKLQAFAIIKDAFDGDEKNRTAGAISSVIDKSLKAGMTPLMINNVVRFDDKSGEYIPNVGDAASISSFMEHRNNIVKNQAMSMGILNADGTIRGGRAAADALLPYAEIEGNKVTKWRTVSVTPTGGNDSKASTPPPEAAISALKANPKLAEDFTRKYPAYPASLYLQK